MEIIFHPKIKEKKYKLDIIEGQSVCIPGCKRYALLVDRDMIRPTYRFHAGNYFIYYLNDTDEDVYVIFNVHSEEERDKVNAIYYKLYEDMAKEGVGVNDVEMILKLTDAITAIDIVVAVMINAKGYENSPSAQTIVKQMQQIVRVELSNA